MITYRCDGCGAELPKKTLRYSVKIDVRAAYDELEISLADLIRDHRQEILSLIEQMKRKDPRELEEGVYKCINLDLCPSCQRVFIRNPLSFHQGEVPPKSPIDIDAFLRSLGFGGAP